MPLRWDELGRADPRDFTLLTAAKRLKDNGDLWAGILGEKNDLASIAKIERDLAA